MTRPITMRMARTDDTTAEPPRELSMPESVRIVRQNIVRDETQAAYRELAQPTPCDTCELAQWCKDSRLACKRFLSFVHGARWAWRSIKSRTPTRALYSLAMADPTPAEFEAAMRCRPEQAQDTADALASGWVGRKVGAREVVGVERRGNHLRLRLWCLQCGAEGLHDADAARVKQCRCMKHAARIAESQTRISAEWIGKELVNGWRCVRVEFVGRLSRAGVIPYLILQHAGAGVTVRRQMDRVRKGCGLAPPSSRHCLGLGRGAAREQAKAQRATRKAQREQARAERAAMLRKGDAIDALCRAEQWKPCAR